MNKVVFPWHLSIVCENCKKHALFSFPTIKEILQNADHTFFEDSPYFEVEYDTAFGAGKKKYAAFYKGLYTNNLPKDLKLPKGYALSDWKFSNYWYRASNNLLGVINCSQCLLKKKKTLTWSQDAFYKVEIKSNLLWAFDRESAEVLFKFIKSKDRKVNWEDKYYRFLSHIPKKFQDAKVRDLILEKLKSILT